jgi:hypothetical protein
MQVAAVVQPFEIREFVLGVAEQIYAVAVHSVRQQDFGGEPRHANRGVVQELSTLE